MVDTRVSDEYRQFVKYVQGLNSKGYIYPDLTLPNKDRVTELVTNGIVGFFTDGFTWFMPMYRPSAYLARMFEQNRNAKVEYVAPFIKADGKQSTLLEATPIWAYTCIGKNTTDAQLIKILQIFEAQHADNVFHNFIWRGTEGTHFTINQDGMAVYTKDYETLDSQQRAGLKTFFVNVRTPTQMVYSYGKEAGVQIDFMNKYYAPNEKFKIFPGTINDASREYGADVNKVADEFFIKALNGSINVDNEWNSYVDTMNRSGLTRIMDEYNKIYSAKK